MKALLNLQKLLSGRTAALGSYKRMAILFALLAGGFWLYVVLASPGMILEPQAGHSGVLIQALLFVIVFEGMLTAARLTHDAWVTPGHLLLFPVSGKKKAGLLLLMVGLDIKSGVYLVSGLCLIAFFAWHGWVAPAVSILLVFGVAYAVTCVWEVMLLFFFHRFLAGKEQQYAQGLLTGWLLLLGLFIGYIPESLLVRLPFVSTFHHVLMVGVTGHTGRFLVQITGLTLYALPAMVLVPLLEAGGWPRSLTPYRYSVFRNRGGHRPGGEAP